MNQVRGRIVQREGLWFENPDQDLRIRVPEAGASLSAGREVVLGVRPELLLITASDAGDLNGTVEEIEPLGHELLVMVRVGAVPVTLRCEAGQALTLGGAVGIAVARGGHHWFDAGTEERLLGQHRVISRLPRRPSPAYLLSNGPGLGRYICRVLVLLPGRSVEVP